jgi:hypothetical protein
MQSRRITGKRFQKLPQRAAFNPLLAAHDRNAARVVSSRPGLSRSLLGQSRSDVFR